MKLEVLASGSSGNCYLLHTSAGTIILEAGVKWADVLKALNFDITSVIYCLITHEHQDHAKYASEYLKAGIKVKTAPKTAKALGLPKSCEWTNNTVLLKSNVYMQNFDTQHDAAEPIGFYIVDQKTEEKLVFATDTYYVKYKFSDVDHILVECNYANDILGKNIEQGFVHPLVASRLLTSHFELSKCKEFVKTNSSRNLKNVVLLHLSNENACAARFLKEFKQITSARVNIARKGLKLDLNECRKWEEL